MKLLKCPACGSDKIGLKTCNIFMGDGYLEVNILDASYKWHDDPEKIGYKCPEVAVHIDCDCGVLTTVYFGCSVDWIHLPAGACAADPNLPNDTRWSKDYDVALINERQGT